MPIGTVALSNTFNEFRTSVNDVINTLNSVVSASGVVSANTLTLTGTTDSSSNTTGTLIVAGGAGIAKKLYVGTEINLGDDKLLQVGRLRTTSNAIGGYILQNDNSPLRLGANNSFPLQVTVGSGVAASNVEITTNLTVNGNVAIGPTTPTTKLHLYGAGANTSFYANGDASGSTAYLQSSGGLSGDGGQILFGATQGVFAGIKGMIANGTGPAGDLLFQTRTTSGNVIERMRIDSAGAFGFGIATGGDTSFYFGRDIDGAATSYGGRFAQTINSTVVTTTGIGVHSQNGTSGVTTSVHQIRTEQGTFSGAVTNQMGLFAGSSLTGATNNYGVYSNIAAAANRYNFYAAGTAANLFSGVSQFAAGTAALPGITQISDLNTGIYFPAADTIGFTTGGSERMRIDSAGNVGIGGTPSAGQTLSLTKTVTGAVASNVVFNSATIASDVTTVARGYFSSFATQAAAFTLTTLEHFRANQSTIGAASVVTQQFGFNADSTLIGATTNYGYYSAIAAAANRYNFYAFGTADNYFAGKVGVGNTPISTAKFLVGGAVTGSASQSAAAVNVEHQSDVTTSAIGVSSTNGTQATSFTLTSLSSFQALQGTFGGGSAVTNQYGFISNANLTGATNNYGFFSNIASGTNRYNFYAAGTADNYFAGDVGIGLAPTTKLQVYGAGTTAAFYTNGDASGSTVYLQSSGGAAGDGGQILFGATQGVFAGIKGMIANGTGPAGDLIFQTRTTSGNVIERMRIISTGEVGIGAAPTSAAKSTITSTSAGNTTIALSLQNASSTIGSETVLDFVTNNNGAGVRSAQITAINTNGGTGVNMLFKIGNGAVATEAMRIDSLGNLTGQDNKISRYMLSDTGYKYYDSTTTNALDYVNGSNQRWAPATGAQTLSITNWPPTGNLGELLIEGVNLGAATITWPIAINWIKSDGTTTTTFSLNGVTLQTSGTDFVYLWTRNAGTTIYGKITR